MPLPIDIGEIKAVSSNGTIPLNAGELSHTKTKTEVSPEESKLYQTSSSGQDFFRNIISPFIRSLAIQTGRAGGGVVGSTLGPAGTLAGGLGGGILADQLFQQGQRLSPNYFGLPPEDVTSGLTESALNTGLDIGLSKLPGGIKAIINRVAKHIGPVNPTVPVQEALNAAPDFPVTAGQATQSKLLTALEDIAQPHEKQLIQTTQRNLLSKEANQVLDYITQGKFAGASREELPIIKTAENTSAKALTRYNAFANSANARWENFKNIELPKIQSTATRQIREEVPNPMYTAGMVTPQGQPFPQTITKITSEPVQITAPVQINRTAGFTNDVISSLDQELEQTENPLVKSKLLELRRVLQPFENPAVNANNEPVVNYLDAKGAVDTLHKIIRDKDIAPKSDRLVNLQSAVENLLRSDINESAKLWPQSAQRAFERAKAGTKALGDLFRTDLGSKVINPKDLQTQVIGEALTNPEKAIQYYKASGTKIPLQTEFFTRLLENSTDENGYFHGGNGLKYLNDNLDVAKQVFNVADRSRINYLLRKMQAVDPKLVEAGRVAAGIRAVGAGLAVGGGAMQLILGSGVPTAGLTTGGLVLTGIPLVKKAVSTLLLDPTNARIIANLSHLPPTSQAAQSMTKTLLKAVGKAGLEMIPLSTEVRNPQDSNQP